MAEGGRKLLSVSFEVFGKVQGVFFRKNTKETADRYRLRGWVKNTDRGTVTGEVQGPEDDVMVMMKWLQHTGSPKSKIEKCEFSDKKTVEKYQFTGFDIQRKMKKKIR
ncbi:acylphosphatase-2-like isoform X2 [Haliotis rufescens]|uniref:acylphosphatase-2-like isoform X2 n=1 Tax=Haliotis rufescens TaxID=6454 RepID=UPI00201EDF10|nr:acylphosphatase-2-like isoform X2 [Haliotis rufescens]